MKKQNIPLTEEEVNSLMRELKTIEIEDMADRAKIVERSEELEKQDEADLAQLMKRGGKIKHKKGGGFTYNMGGKVKTMSEYMKEMLGGREMLEQNFQGGGSISDIMLMNVNPMTAVQRPMDYGGPAKKKYQQKGNIELMPEPTDLTAEMMASIEGKQTPSIPVRPAAAPPVVNNTTNSDLSGPPIVVDWDDLLGSQKEKEKQKINLSLDEIDYSVDPVTNEPFKPLSKTMSQIQAEFEKDGTIPSYADWSTAWQMENPDGPVPSEESFTAMWSAPDPSQLPIDDPLNPNYMANKYPTVQGGVPIGQVDNNNDGIPDYLEGQDPLTKEILDTSELMGPKPYNPDDYNIDDDYVVEAPLTIPPKTIENLTLPTQEQTPMAGGVDPNLLTSDVSTDLEADAASRYNMTQDTNEFLEDGVTRNPNYGKYKDERGNTLDYNEGLGMWMPSDINNLPPSGPNVARPQQTIKELLSNMNIKKNLPDYLGGAGSAISGLGPLWATQQAGLDTDEVNYFENVEDAAIAEQEKALGVFDDGKESARRVIERQQRQGQKRLQDYVMSAGQRRAGERALDVAMMEQIPLSDIRFDTQKSQIYNQLAQQRLQGDIYDATGATARDDKLDQNRDAYWTAMSENLSNLGTQTQNFAKNMAQKRTNQLQELAYLNNMARGEMDRFIIKDGQIVPNPDYVG